MIASSLDCQAYHFLNPDNFRTKDDLTTPRHAIQQYLQGLEYGSIAKAIYIGYSGYTVYTRYGGEITSFYPIGLEGLCSADLLRGFLDSGATIYIHRFCGEYTAAFKIQ